MMENDKAKEINSLARKLCRLLDEYNCRVSCERCEIKICRSIMNLNSILKVVE